MADEVKFGWSWEQRYRILHAENARLTDQNNELLASLQSAAIQVRVLQSQIPKDGGDGDGEPAPEAGVPGLA